ncbi:hypothetical protein HDU96_010590 [Phlyctochytrium bullatum]|nr:hypothetical protein HDU96_010590 [Phlyctochytrium bullatum]
MGTTLSCLIPPSPFAPPTTGPPVLNGKLNVAWARSRFPALVASDMVFMDNAGGSAVLGDVAERVAKYLVSTNVQLGASYRTSKESTELVKLGTEAGRRFVNAAFADEIVLGASTTQLVENLARTMEEGLKPTDEIIVSSSDHEANVGPFVRMAKRKGLTLKVWEVNTETLEMDLEALEALLTENTRLVAITHCSNILGTVNDVKAIAERVHRIPGAEICVDGVAYAPHRAIDVQALDVDFYVFSWYKVYGPHISQLYTRRAAAARLTPQAHFFLDPHERPYVFQPGGQNYELSAALVGVLAYVAEAGGKWAPPEGPGGSDAQKARELLGSVGHKEIGEGFGRFEAWEAVLGERLLGWLRAREGVRVVGRREMRGRVPTVAFVVKGVKSREVVEAVDRADIGIRFGHFVTHRLVVGNLGLDEEDGVVRVSLVHYNTLEEVDRLIAVLERVIPGGAVERDAK